MDKAEEIEGDKTRTRTSWTNKSRLERFSRLFAQKQFWANIFVKLSDLPNTLLARIIVPKSLHHRIWGDDELDFFKQMSKITIANCWLWPEWPNLLGKLSEYYLTGRAIKSTWPKSVYWQTNFQYRTLYEFQKLI